MGNLNEISSAAVDADVRQLQTDDLTWLGDDESSAGQLWPRCNKGEVAISGQHVQTSYRHTHIHTHITMTVKGLSKHLQPYLNSEEN